MTSSVSKNIVSDKDEYYFLDKQVLDILKQEAASDALAVSSRLHDIFQIFIDQESTDHPFLRDCPTLCFHSVEIVSSYPSMLTKEVSTESHEGEDKGIDTPKLTASLMKKVMLQFAKYDVCNKFQASDAIQNKNMNDIVILCKNEKQVLANSTILKFSNDYFYSMLCGGMQESTKKDNKHCIDLRDTFSIETVENIKNYFYTTTMHSIPSIEIATELYHFGELLLETELVKTAAAYCKTWSSQIRNESDLEKYIDIMSAEESAYRNSFSIPIKAVTSFLKGKNIKYSLNTAGDGILLHHNELYRLKRSEKVDRYIRQFFRGFTLDQIGDFQKIALLAFMPKELRDQVVEISVLDGLTEKQLAQIAKLFPRICLAILEIADKRVFTELSLRSGEHLPSGASVYGAEQQVIRTINNKFFEKLMNYKQFESLIISTYGEEGQNRKKNWIVVNPKLLEIFPKLPKLQFSDPSLVAIGLESREFFKSKYNREIAKLQAELLEYFKHTRFIPKTSVYNSNYESPSYLECESLL